MARKIHILPDALTNQIAAGEVVERPASVVKELLENSLDAAAVSLDVELQNGGKTEIRVADDGFGMEQDDALLALDRYATSKIAAAKDLESVRTFGFRGEALPSIAAVSDFVLETAAAGAVGTRVRVRSGRITSVEDCARQRGTTVTVRRLFWNLPARAKFLKSAAVETRAVVEVVLTLALTNLSAAFRLVSGGRVLLDLPPAPDLPSRIGRIWGESYAGEFLILDRNEEHAHIAGLIQRPDSVGRSPRRSFLFVQGRPFRDPGLVQAVDRAYRTTLSQGERPSLFLYLGMADGAVDVNVHPSKAEVRFRDRSGVEREVESAVREALSRLESAATLDEKPTLPQLDKARPRAAGAVREVPEEEQLAFFVRVAEPVDGLGDSGSSSPVGQEPGDATEPLHATLLWQVHSSYIVAETRTGLLLVDQHAAHERVLFEELMRSFQGESDVEGPPSQQLLFPLTIRLSPAEYAILEEFAGLFRRTGFRIEPFGGSTVIVHAAPHPHPRFDAEACLRDMLAELASGSELTRAATNQHERIAMVFACKAAIKAGQKLSEREMEELFDRLFATELPHHDVHGRPTVIRLSFKELERRFGRHG